MKLNTSFLASAASAAFVGSVCAQTPIDITGSTAGRSAVHTQILALLSDETAAYVGSSFAGANNVIYKGKFAGGDVIIRTSWSGSAAGVRDVSQQLAINFLNTTTATVANPPTQTNSPSFVTSAPEIAFSDVFQSSTAFTSPALIQQDQVGVIPFKFFKNKGADAGLNNMTSQLFRSLYAGPGESPLSLFTGVSTDASKTVFATGRNPESGTRITTLAETNTPLGTLLSQFSGSVSTTAGPTFGVATLDPAFDPSPNAFSSGGQVATLLTGTLPAGQSLVGYLGASDWNTATGGLNGTNFATEIAFNGVTLGANNALIQNGKYTLWGYLQQSSMSLSGTPATFYTSLKNNLLAAPGTGLVLIGSMNVERAADGATVIPK